MKAAVEELAQAIPITAACAAFGFARSSLYRLRQEPTPKTETPKSHTHHRALSESERTQVLDTLHSERFQDSPPRQVWATLLDEGEHPCSVSTMYRLLGLGHRSGQEGEFQARVDVEAWKAEVVFGRVCRVNRLGSKGTQRGYDGAVQRSVEPQWSHRVG